MRRFSMTVTSKGQVTLPAEYRRLVGAGPGTRLDLLVDDAGGARLQKRAGSLIDHYGSLAAYARERPVSDEDIAEAVDSAMAEQDARSRGATRS